MPHQTITANPVCVGCTHGVCDNHRNRPTFCCPFCLNISWVQPLHRSARSQRCLVSKKRPLFHFLDAVVQFFHTNAKVQTININLRQFKIVFFQKNDIKIHSKTAACGVLCTDIRKKRFVEGGLRRRFLDSMPLRSK